MFLKKSLLFTTALALLMFAGQASAQVSLSLGEGGSATVTGAGTEIAVDVSQMGVAAEVNAIQIVFDIDTSVLTLTGASATGFIALPVTDGNTATLVPASIFAGIADPVPVPASASFTFTTASDVTGVEFTIGISSVLLDGNALPVPLPAALMFNAGGTPPDGNGDNGGDNGDTGMPEPTEMSVSLTSGGESEINQVGAGAEIVVDVAVDGLTGMTTGAEITFTVDPAVAAITGGAPAAGLVEAPGGDGMTVTLIGAPTMLEGGSYGSVTFTTDPDYDGSTFSISASVTVFTASGTRASAAAGDPVLVNQLSFYLMPDVSEAVTVLPGGSGMATVTAMDVGDEEVTFAVEGEGVEHSAEGATVTLTASGTATATVTATVRSFTTDPVTVEFVQGALTLSSDATEAVTVLPGGSGMVTLTLEGAAEGAEVAFALEEGSEGATLDGATVSASGAATAIVTAWVGDVGSNAVTVAFEQGALTLSADATEVTIGPDGGSATLTLEGAAEGAEVAFALAEGSAATLDGSTLSASVATTATVTASVGDVMSNAVEVSFVPSMGTEMTEVTIPRDGSATATIMAFGFSEGADITFSITGGAGFEALDDGVSWVVTMSTPGDVTVSATDGTTITAPLKVTFMAMGPELVADVTEATVPVGGSATVVVTALDLGDTGIIYSIDESGTDVVNAVTDGATVTLTATGSAVVTVTATAGAASAAPITITFTAGELTLEASKSEVMVPVGGSGSATVTASGQADDDDVAFAVEGDGVTAESDGATVTLSASGAATATVTASVGEVSSAPITVEFVDGALALVSSADAAVTVLPGGTGTATVTLMNLAEGDEASFTIETTEGVAAEEGDTAVTLTASGAGSATVTAMVNGLTTGSVTVEFEQGALMLSSDADAAVTVLPGGSGMATLTASGQAEGAEVAFSSDNEAVTVTENEDGTSATVTASGAATATVTAAVGDVTATVDVAFEQAPLMLSSDADAAVTVLPGGSGMATLTASGQAEGAEVAFSSDNEAVTVTENEDGTSATVTASGAATATVTAAVGDVTATVDVAFEQAPLMLSSDADAAVTVLPGGSGMATLTASGQADGAEVAFALEEGSEGATLDGATVSASGAATAIVTAWVGDVGSNAVTVEFVQGALTLSEPGDAIISYGGSGSATLTASGQADGATVTFTVEGDGVTSDDGEAGTVTVSASAPTTAMVTAAVGDVMSNTVTVAFVDAPPELRTETRIVEFPYGGAGEASVMAVGFAEDAQIQFEITGGTLNATDDHSVWTVSTATPGDVMLRATDGMVWTDLLTITFKNPHPYLVADAMDVIIPTGGSVVVTVTVIGLDANSTVYTFTERSGTAKVDLEIQGGQAVLTGSGEGSASVTLVASDGTSTTESVTIIFRAMPTVSSETPNVTIPPTTAPSESATVTVEGFAEGTEVEVSVVVVSGDATHTVEGNTVTITSAGSAVVSVTASGDGVTTDPVTVTFTKDAPAAPGSVVVEDNPGDHGYYVMVSFAHSANHIDVSQYRVYREMMVTTTMDADGNVVTTDTPVAKWVSWAVVDAVPSEEGMSRAVVPVTDNTATRWGVSAEAGMGSAEDVITPAGKRVFSKESVQLMAQILGLDPNRVVSQDELSQMFMPSADYIKSIIGDRKNVVFAALDPDMSVLIGGDMAVPQNIRTDGSGPILSSPITETKDIRGAADNIAPAAVTDVAADVETGMVTWTMSADDMVVGMINYRGYAFSIPGVQGYKVMGGASENAMIEIGVVPAGATSFQVPQALIESLINQGLPAVLLSIVALDGTHMTPSVPLVVELIPTRKAFVDADGGSVYVVKLDRDGAMTPLTVDFEDFVAFTMAFNTDETHENWRVFVQADLNDDKMVSFEDFILFFSSYGKEAQGPAGKSLVTPVLGVNENAEFSLRLGSDRVVAGENMFVDVSLANVQALMGYGFVLHFNAEKFEFVEVVPAAEDLLLSSGGETPLLKGWSPEAGQVRVMNGIVNGSEVSGGGDIVRLVFRVLRNFEDDARFEIAEGLVFDPSQLANPLTGGVLDIQTTPTEFALLQNFPNPFNPDTTIGYELAESADVTLQIYNVVGQVVRTLMAAESQSVGRYQVRWDGIDDRGMPVSSGIYFYQISAGKFQDVRKLMLLK